MPDELVKRGYLTQSLGNAVHSGEHGLQNVPGLLYHALDIHAWQKRIIVETGEEFDGYATFKEYIEDYPPKGLGADEDTLRKLISSDTRLLRRFNAALRRANGRPGKTFNIIKSFPEESKPLMGDSKAYALQKLFDEKRVDLLEQVDDGKISAHAAMIRAEYRKPKISIRLDNPQSAAKTLLTHASPEFLAELRRLLNP